jgi:hypothetical protein
MAVRVACYGLLFHLLQGQSSASMGGREELIWWGLGVHSVLDGCGKYLLGRMYLVSIHTRDSELTRTLYGQWEFSTMFVSPPPPPSSSGPR